jgi:hypothetical protein
MANGKLMVSQWKVNGLWWSIRVISPNRGHVSPIIGIIHSVVVDGCFSWDMGNHPIQMAGLFRFVSYHCYHDLSDTPYLLVKKNVCFCWIHRACSWFFISNHILQQFEVFHLANSFSGPGPGSRQNYQLFCESYLKLPREKKGLWR